LRASLAATSVSDTNPRLASVSDVGHSRWAGVGVLSVKFPAADDQVVDGELTL
jgi:hypothetical protein